MRSNKIEIDAFYCQKTLCKIGTFEDKNSKNHYAKRNEIRCQHHIEISMKLL